MKNIIQKSRSIAYLGIIVLLVSTLAFTACRNPSGPSEPDDPGPDPNLGITWTGIAAGDGGSTFASNQAIQGIAYGGDRFVAVGAGGRMAYSPGN